MLRMGKTRWELRTDVVRANHRRLSPLAMLFRWVLTVNHPAGAHATLRA